MGEVRLPFAIRVRGGFDEDGVWVVRGELTYHDHLSARAREVIAEDASLYLLNAIHLEADRGRLDLGATQVRVIAQLGDSRSLEYMDDGKRR